MRADQCEAMPSRAFVYLVPQDLEIQAALPQSLRDLMTAGAVPVSSGRRQWMRVEMHPPLTLCPALSPVRCDPISHSESVPHLLLSLPHGTFPIRKTSVAGGASHSGQGAPPNSPPSSEDPEVILTELLIQSYLTDSYASDVPGSGWSEFVPEEVDLIAYLDDCGMRTLAASLREGNPRIEALRVPMLMEAVTTLETVGREQAGRCSAGECQILMDFALDLVEGVLKDSVELDESERRECYRRLHATLGRMLYLADEDIRSLLLICDPSNRRRTILQIAQRADAALKGHCAKVEALYRRHLHTGLQSAQASFRAYIPHVLAEVLLCRNGHLNIGVIDDLTMHILPMLEGDPLMQLHIEFVFRKLRSSAELREQITEVQGPEPGNKTANDLLRVIIGLKKGTQCGAAEVRQAILSGLFSYMRQGDSRACFATALALLLHNSAKELFVRDALQLVTEAGLEKNVAG
ncbi:MAG: hypothetical protein KDK78_05200, partial [Chlamydiia bacterium]|nr:hypothetical protein [Chlamydiia bacterium]